MNTHSIIILDPQYITQVGISTILSKQIEYPIYLANDKKELIKLMTSNSNALVVLDLTLSDIASTDDLYNLISRFSEAKWILFSEDFTVPLIKRLQHLPSLVSFLLKSSTLEDTSNCIKMVANNQNYLSPLLKNMIEEEDNERKEKLTITEEEILREIANGLSAKQVAQKRSASVHTIVTHKKNIYRKLQINTIQEAYIYAMRAGLLNINDYAI